MRDLILGVCAAAVLALTVQAQEPPAPAAPTKDGAVLDLSPPDAAALIVVDVARSVKGRLVMKAPSGDIPVPIDEKSTLRWIDETSARGADSPIQDRRDWLEYQSTNRGINKDLPLAGIDVSFSYEDGAPKVQLTPPRRILKTQLEWMLRHATCAGLRLPLPREAKLGSSFEFDCAPLLYTLFDFDGTIRDLKGGFSLARIDEKTGRATVAGAPSWIEDTSKNGITASSPWSATLEIDVDPATRAVVEVRCKGRITPTGTGAYDGKFSGTLDFDCTLTAKPATEAAGLRDKKPTFRDNTYTFAGVEFQAPACWIEIEDPPANTFQLIDSRDAEPAVIQLQNVADRNDARTDEYLKALTDQVKKSDPKAKVQRVSSSAFGKAITIETHSQSGDLHKSFVVQAGDGRQILAKIFGEEEAVKKKEADFRKLAASLKPAKK